MARRYGVFGPEMASPRLVAFYGLKGVGKDTSALILRGDPGSPNCGGRIFKFATTLKAMTAALLGVPAELLDGDSELSRDFREREHATLKKVTGGKLATPRQALQWLGTEVGRQMLHPDIWVNLLMQRLDAYIFASSACPAYVTDVRFKNEYEALAERGALHVLVERPGVAAGDAHVSEALPFDKKSFDFIISNDGDLAELAVKLEPIKKALSPRPGHCGVYLQ